MKNGKAAIVYDKQLCSYEIAIPWSEFNEGIRKAVEKRRFLYGIAINDDDAIGSRHFMERFSGSIIVITSYSIHYTKLYDPAAGLKCNIR